MSDGKVTGTFSDSGVDRRGLGRKKPRVLNRT